VLTIVSQERADGNLFTYFTPTDCITYLFDYWRLHLRCLDVSTWCCNRGQHVNTFYWRSFCQYAGSMPWSHYHTSTQRRKHTTTGGWIETAVITCETKRTCYMFVGVCVSLVTIGIGAIICRQNVLYKVSQMCRVTKPGCSILFYATVSFGLLMHVYYYCIKFSFFSTTQRDW